MVVAPNSPHPLTEHPITDSIHRDLREVLERALYRGATLVKREGKSYRPWYDLSGEEVALFREDPA